MLPSGNKLKVSEVKKELSENLTSFMIQNPDLRT